MKKSELKQVLRPLIKECIKEVIFEEGILSNIVSEVAHGLGGNTLVASKQHVTSPVQQDEQEQHEQETARQKIQETRKRMLDAIGSDSYNGIDLFEGTAPAPQESNPSAALSGIDPKDAGVDINKIFGGASKNWSHMFK
jgi:hypothetical protein|tara:strand:- start:221 stop:637 length:417 start_codon:yes stop_codon:yes gene_type:complete